MKPESSKPNVTQGTGDSEGALNATPVYDEKEEQAILDLSGRQGLSRKQLLRQALREYQSNVLGTVDLGPKLPPSDASPVHKGLWTVEEYSFPGCWTEAILIKCGDKIILRLPVQNWPVEHKHEQWTKCKAVADAHNTAFGTLREAIDAMDDAAMGKQEEANVSAVKTDLEKTEVS